MYLTLWVVSTSLSVVYITLSVVHTTLSLVYITLSVVRATLSVAKIYSVGCKHLLCRFYALLCRLYVILCRCKDLLCRLYALLYQLWKLLKFNEKDNEMVQLTKIILKQTARHNSDDFNSWIPLSSLQDLSDLYNSIYGRSYKKTGY